MRPVVDVTLSRCVLHLVAPKGGGLELSERDLPMPEGEDIYTFFTAHIMRGLHDSQTQAANFVAVRADRTSGWCQRLLTHPDEFLDLSQQIAQQLYEVMARDARVADGTLAVITYRATSDGGPADYIALLKLDPSDAFRPVTLTDGDGLTYLGLEVAQDIMPSTRERLHKSVFIQLTDQEADYNLLVLDRQTEAAVARFYISDFLGAELAFDDRRRTETLYRALQAARSRIAPRLAADDLKALDMSIGGVMVGHAINLDQWLPTLPVAAEDRQVFETVVAEALPDREFDLDEGIRSRFVRRRRFQGDNGLVVQMDARFFDDMVEIEDVPNTNPPVRRVVITTREWREVS